jgi:hypothetical protein
VEGAVADRALADGGYGHGEAGGRCRGDSEVGVAVGLVARRAQDDLLVVLGDLDIEALAYWAMFSVEPTYRMLIECEPISSR